MISTSPGAQRNPRNQDALRALSIEIAEEHKLSTKDGTSPWLATGHPSSGSLSNEKRLSPYASHLRAVSLRCLYFAFKEDDPQAGPAVEINQKILEKDLQSQEIKCK